MKDKVLRSLPKGLFIIKSHPFPESVFYSIFNVQITDFFCLQGVAGKSGIKEKFANYDRNMSKFQRDLDDAWKAMDALSNPLQ